MERDGVEGWANDGKFQLQVFHHMWLMTRTQGLSTCEVRGIEDAREMNLMRPHTVPHQIAEGLFCLRFCELARRHGGLHVLSGVQCKWNLHEGVRCWCFYWPARCMHVKLYMPPQ